MILTKSKITQKHKEGQIIYQSDLTKIEDNVQNQSVDVNLGNWLYFEFQSPLDFYIFIKIGFVFCNQAINLKSIKDLQKLGFVSQESTRQRVWINMEKVKTLVIPKNMFFLAHTEQFIGTIGGSNIHTQFYQRSSIARLGLIHPLAGWGDVGYFNRWALEFFTGQEVTIHANMRIGQITFSDTYPESTDYTEETGNYQNTNNLKSLVENWRKEDILPKKNNF